MSKILVVIDMQNDFIDGALGTPEAQAIVPNVIKKIKETENSGGVVVFTRDTHNNHYLETQEGKNLPVKHCIRGTTGWKIKESVLDASNDTRKLIFDKPTFGSDKLAKTFADIYTQQPTNCTEVELVGVCTGICVISNAIVIKSLCPELPITVDASCCACVTPESHKRTLEAMKLLQINIINE